MKRRILVPIVLLLFSALGAFGQSTITLTADLKTLFGGNQATKAKLCLSLVDATGQAVPDPHVAGSAVLVQTDNVCVSPDANGLVSTALIPNDQITAAGTLDTTLYSITTLYNGAPVHGALYHFALSEVTVSLDTKAPSNITPLVTPTLSDATYMRIDAGNSPTTALWKLLGLGLLEQAAPTCVAGVDFVWADSAAHRLKKCDNGGSAVQFVQSGVDINTSDQVTATHLASPLPTAQGGTAQNSTATFPTSGTVNTGTGTNNIIPKFTTGASGIIGNSAITDNGTVISSTEPYAEVEVAAPSGVASSDLLYADSTAHRWKMNNNNGGALTVAATSGDTFTSTTLTSPVINSTPTGTGIPTITLKKGTGLGNYNGTNTSFADVDATNLAYTVTIPTGWKLSIQVNAVVFPTTATTSVGLALLDTSVVVENQVTAVLNNTTASTLGWAITGDGASHTIKLQAKTTAGADAWNIFNDTATRVPTMTFLLTPSN